MSKLESSNSYARLSNLILGFHGCTEETYNRVILKGEQLVPGESHNDWLGRGLYFWEQNLSRAWSWANEQAKKKGTKPAVIGAVIDLGLCLNLTEERCIKELENAYTTYKEIKKAHGEPLPKNKDVKVGETIIEGEELYRPLDFEVIESLHKERDRAGEPAYDSVRGIFLVEGDRVYPTSGVRAKSHIQLCIRNPECIKGYFTPIESK